MNDDNLALVLQGFRSDIKELRDDIRELRRTLLSPEKVSEMIGEALRKNEARGWTARERWMGVGLFVFALVNFSVGISVLIKGQSG